MTEQELAGRKAWEDDVMKGANYIKNFADFILKERSQLYGVIIYLMLKSETKEIELPPIEEFHKYGEDFYVLFSQDPETKSYWVRLLEQENND